MLAAMKVLVGFGKTRRFSSTLLKNPHHIYSYKTYYIEKSHKMEDKKENEQ